MIVFSLLRSPKVICVSAGWKTCAPEIPIRSNVRCSMTALLRWRTPNYVGWCVLENNACVVYQPFPISSSSAPGS
jgi:hypothetical protein